MKVAMSRFVMPLMLFALAVKSNHMFPSRWLNTQLFSHGFAESYNEVVCFKQGLVMTEDVDNILQSRAYDNILQTVSSLLLVTMPTTILPPYLDHTSSWVFCKFSAYLQNTFFEE